MNDIKGFFESKTVWGGLVAFVSGVGMLFHYSISPADAASVVDLITGVPATLASAVAIYGRVVASTKIG